MNVAEMKLEAIKKISKIEDEKFIKEVLDLLSKLSFPEEENKLNLTQHYDNVKEQYGNTLQKLAQ